MNQPINTYQKILARQVKRHLTPELQQAPQLQYFLAAVNDSYLNFERDQHLHEQSVRLTDAEHLRITTELRQELAKKAQIESMLLGAIDKLDQPMGDPAVNANAPPSHVQHDTPKRRHMVDLMQTLNHQIDQLKEMDQQLCVAKQAAEAANQAKTDFLSMMSHEIRTPLNSVIGLTHIMVKEDTIASYREHLPTLRICAQNLNLLINDILDFNKIGSGKLVLERVPFSVRQVIDEVAQALQVNAQERDNRIVIQTDTRIPSMLLGDPLRLGQILTNLVSNACKFTHHGQVTIACELGTSEQPTPEGHELIRFTVTDTGIGIAKDKQALIFEEFTQADSHTTRRYGGTGLGLVITNRLLKLWHSHIVLQSQLGQGSSFAFSLLLPLADKGLTPQHETHPDAQPLQGLRVLLVEDVALNVVVAKKLLEMWGVEVFVAANGQIAVELCEQSHHDLVLMDIQMPVMDGYTAARLIHAKYPCLPIVALTASASLENQDLAFTSGMCDYVTKPINPRDLNAKLFQYGAPALSQRLALTPHPQPMRGAVLGSVSDPVLDPARAIAHFGDADLVTQLLQTLAQTLPADVALLSRAAQAGDSAQLAKTLHQLKSFLPLVVDDETAQLLLEAESQLSKSSDKQLPSAQVLTHLNRLLTRLTHISDALTLSRNPPQACTAQKA